MEKIIYRASIDDMEFPYTDSPQPIQAWKKLEARMSQSRVELKSRGYVVTRKTEETVPANTDADMGVRPSMNQPQAGRFNWGALDNDSKPIPKAYSLGEIGLAFVATFLGCTAAVIFVMNIF